MKTRNVTQSHTRQAKGLVLLRTQNADPLDTSILRGL
jgi:hypothetical protein